MIPPACARRNSVQVGPVRLGAGPSRAVRSRVRIVVALTRRPSLQLAVDPDAAPPGVLPGHPENERTDFRVDGRPSRAPAPTVGPLPPHELAVPPEERRRGDKEGDPAVTRQDATRRREE